jgi:hypothetical protein
MRMAISRCRAAPRASNRFATLAQAISSTTPTTTIRVSSAKRYCERTPETPLDAGAVLNVLARYFAC